MAKESDHQLLRRYLKEQSGEAFRIMVDRHLPLVHSTARRVTANTEAAQDIAQKVFLKLSRQAVHLSAKQSLTAWLHRVTHNASVDHVRGEVRRQNREKISAELITMNSEIELWNEVSPIIDSAIDSLVEKDRAIVLLRFYENRTYPEIAREFGTSEDAIRMRANRALEKLRTVLSRRNITTSAALLATTLPAHALTASPAVLATSITTAVKAATPTSSLTLTSLLVMTKPHLASIVTILIAAPIIGFQQYRVSSLETENDSLRATSISTAQRSNATLESTALIKKSVSPPQRKKSTAPKTTDIATALEQFWAQYNGLGLGHPSLTSGAIKLLKGLPSKELFAFCREMEPSQKRNLLVATAMKVYGATEPEACLEFTSHEPGKTQPRLARAVLLSWITTSPDHALDWFVKNELQETPMLGSSAARDSLSKDLANALANKGDYDKAISFAQKLTGSKRQGIAIKGILKNMHAGKLVAFGNKLLELPESAPIRWVGIEKMANSLAAQNLEEGKKWAASLNEENPITAHSAVEGVAKSWIKTDAKAAADWWIQNTSPDKARETYSTIVEIWAESAPIHCGEWLIGLAKSQKLDGARAAYSRAIAERDPESAKAWAQEITDENLRAVVELELKSK